MPSPPAPPAATRERKCERCDVPFIPKRSWQIYCSSKCRWEAFNAKNPRQKNSLGGRR